jgi:preprotein translocase subunit SecY
MTPENMRRIAFTFGALLIYRLGVYIPLPGIDPEFWAQIFNTQSGGILGQANLFSGGAVRRLGIFSLSITPYVSAAIVLQLMTMASPTLRALRNGAERGRSFIDLYTRYGTVFLAAIQSYGLALGLEGTGQLVADPGFLFRLSTVLTLTGGTVFLVWLTGQITARGIGNGIALILLAGIATELPRELFSLVQRDRLGLLPDNTKPALMLIVIAVVVGVVAMELARRRLVVQFPARQAGDRTLPSRSSHLALKLNPAGLMPVVLTSWLPLVVTAPATLATLYAGQDLGWASELTARLGYGQPLHLLVSAALLIFFTFFYTALVCDPDDMAAKLETHGGAVPDVAPGEATAAHLDHVLSRTAAMGAAYLAFVLLLPEILTAWLEVPFHFGGASLLILVCVTLDIAARLRADRPLAPPSEADG